MLPWKTIESPPPSCFTVNLLHNMYGLGHVNLLPGPSNGLEILNFFAEALEEEDFFGNPLLKVGDTVIAPAGISPRGETRGGTLVTRAYIKDSTYSPNIQSVY